MRNLLILTLYLSLIGILKAQNLENATALRSGCRILSSPPTYYTSNIHTIKIDPWTVQALLDESNTLGWCSSKNTSFPQRFVFELSEDFTISKLVFDNKCQKEYPGICAKNVKVELSAMSSEAGYADGGTFTLNEYEVSTFELPPNKARWIRLTILSNYGNREYTELMDFRAMGTYADPSYDATNIIGVWNTNFDWVSINGNDNGYIYGCYKWADGTLYSGKVTRRVFEFSWSQKGNGEKGWAIVVINKEGDRLSGIWGYTNNYSVFGFWDFSKKSPTPYSCSIDEEMKNTKPNYTLRSTEEKEVPKENANATLRIHLADAETGQSLDGKVVVVSSGSQIAHGNTLAGTCTLQIAFGIPIKVKAEAEGYLAAAEVIGEVSEGGTDITVKLTRLEAGKSVVLQSIRFEQGKYNLLEESFAELDKIVAMMNQYPKMEIELSGHTDNQGSAEKNVELSENRVKEVKNYLVGKGIRSTRVSGVGYGGAKPIASNQTEETRKLNRRVEFKILKM